MASSGAEEPRFTLCDAAVWRDVDGEIVALDVESGSYFSLNGSGRLLWLALLEPRSTGALAGVLAESFGIPNEQAQSDAAAFVGDLVERGLVEADA